MSETKSIFKVAAIANVFRIKARYCLKYWKIGIQGADSMFSQGIFVSPTSEDHHENFVFERHQLEHVWQA
jgi:hypothetical protein